MNIMCCKITKGLISNSKYGFAGLPFGKKREKIKNDLPKYDVVIVGGNLGALLSNHLDSVVGEKASIFVAYDKPVYELPIIRSFYENGMITKYQMQANPKKSISKYCGHSEGQGVTQFLPKENAIILKNGRKVQYDQLVIATGLKNDVDIPGMEDAWNDLIHPFFLSIDHPSWRTTANKSFRYFHNFQGGQSIFYIPPYPFHTQIENYNFFIAKYFWDRAEKHGMFTWANSRFTIINANDSFVQNYDRGDTFIKSQLEKRKINVQYGLKLLQVKKQQKIVIFKNMKTGQLHQRPYNWFYSLVQAKPDEILSNAGLADQTGQLSVNLHTLQHKKYQNIFGLGDVSNLPTTKTFWGSFNQLHVVRHNIVRQLNGLTLNAKYDGTSEAQMHVDWNKMVKLSHSYEGKSNDILDTGMLSYLRYKWSSFNKKSVESVLKFKNWGPPYYYFKKTFKTTGESQMSDFDIPPNKKEY